MPCLTTESVFRNCSRYYFRLLHNIFKQDLWVQIKNISFKVFLVFQNFDKRTSWFYTIFILNFKTVFVSSHMYPENPEETEVIVGSMNMGNISDTARNRTYNLFRLKREPIPLGHSDGLAQYYTVSQLNWYPFCFGNKSVNFKNN